MESEQISVTVKPILLPKDDHKNREGQELKNKKIKKKKLNKLRSIKLSKSPSLKPSTRRPKPHLRNIVVDFSSIDIESLSPPCSTSSSRTDISQISSPLLTRRSSFKKGVRTLTRLSSKKHKTVMSGHDRSSVVSSSGSPRSVKASPRASGRMLVHSKENSAKALTRKASLRPLRVSNKAKRASVAKRGEVAGAADSGGSGGGVEKATCSSTLKDSKFGGGAVQVEHGEAGCEVDSAMKVCPFSYCSLHGHRHRANVPPLQRLISIRRHMMRNERSRVAQERAARGERRPRRARNEGPVSPVEEVERDFFVEFGTEMKDALNGESGSCGEEEEGAESLVEKPVGEDSVSQTVVGSTRLEKHEEQVFKVGSDSVGETAISSESRDGNAETMSGKGSSSESLSELENEQIGANREEKENLEPERSAAVKIKLKDQKYVRMWRLMYKHTVRGVSGSVENPSPLDGADKKTEQEAGDSEGLIELNSSRPDRTAESVNESFQADAVKLVQQAFDEILLPEIQELSSDEGSVASGVGSGREGLIVGEGVNVEEAKTTTTAQRVSKSWSSLKKILVLKRFVKAMEKVKRINRGTPRFLPLQPEPESERVRLRRLTSEERKNAEEWMLDFALQQVVSKLDSAQQRRVAMLVKAFETVLPLPDLNSSPRPSVEEHTRVDPVQALSTLMVQSGAKTCKEANEEGNCSNSFVGKASSRGLISNFPEDQKSGEAIFRGDQPEPFSENPNSDETLSTSHEAPETGNAQEAIKQPGKPIDSSYEAKKTESETAYTEPFQATATSQAEESDVALDAQSGKQSYMRLWGFVYKHMMSVDESDAKTVDNAKATQGSRAKGDAADAEKAVLRRIEAIKLIEKAIDEIILPDNQDASPDGQTTSGSSDEEPQAKAKKVLPDEEEEKFSSEPPAIPTNESEEKREESLPEKKISRNWSNLKKMILLKRFIKALEGAGASSAKGFNPRAPRFLAVEADAEAEKVNLRRQEMEERKSAEEWMVDHALQQAVARLTPARKKKVQLLVEAFETVTPSVRP